MFNKVTLIGRLCKDGEFKAFNSGAELYENTLALTKKQKNGEEKPIFIKIKIFGNSCKIMRAYTKKGDRIGIIGELDYNAWTAKDGAKKYEHSIIVEQIELLQSKSQSTKPQSQKAQNTQAQSDDCDEIPF